MIKIKFAELHNPLFFSRRNWGTKLDPGQNNMKGLDLKYDRENQELHLKWEGEEAIIPSSNVATMWLGKVEHKEEPISHPQLGSIGSAQVETPYGHVHAGPGKGKTGK
jgi:hypothetical protein